MLVVLRKTHMPLPPFNPVYAMDYARKMGHGHDIQFISSLLAEVNDAYNTITNYEYERFDDLVEDFATELDVDANAIRPPFKCANDDDVVCYDAAEFYIFVTAAREKLSSVGYRVYTVNYRFEYDGDAYDIPHPVVKIRDDLLASVMLFKIQGLMLNLVVITVEPPTPFFRIKHIIEKLLGKAYETYADEFQNTEIIYRDGSITVHDF